VYYSVKEKSRIFAKTGTDLGNAEGSAYANVRWRNLFGGAETLDANVSYGTRTRSAYSAAFDTPVLSNPELRFQVGGVQSATQKVFASHEEVLRGGWSKLRWLTKSGIHEVGYNGFWRQVTGLAQNASPTVRNDAGDSFKSSLTHIWINDRRDNPSLPTRGHYTKTSSEIAGFGPLQGDVAFFKGEVEQQTAIPIPIPGVKGESGVAFTTGLRAGLLYPLTLGSNANPSLSRLNDRFQLGGPTDVRGFRLSGLGPHDGSDAVGGDVYAAGSANLFVPLPKVGPEKPLRLQAFVNGGRLLALRQDKEGDMTGDEVKTAMSRTLEELGNGLPSMSAGIGLVYAHPAARFELNFSLPLVIRKGEDARKGVQFGIGINFL
jgi:outer membrane protein insertion porin family